MFPVETWEKIIGHLWDDVAALAACSATCRAFVPIVRNYHFRYLRLRNARGFESFKVLLDGDEYMTPYIRALAIHGEDGHQDASEFPGDGEWLRLLSRMPRLSHLHLEGFCFHIPGGLRLSLRSWFSSIRTLDLKSVGEDGDSLASLIRASGRLETLIIQSTPALQDVPMVPSLSAVSPLRSVTTLIWNPDPSVSSAMRTLGQWVGKTQLPIQRLSIGSIGAESTPPTFVQQLLDASSQSLEHLRLEFALTATGQAAEQLNLQRNAQLKTLHMTLPMDIIIYSLKLFVKILPEQHCPAWTTLDLRVHLRETLLEEFRLLTARRMTGIHAMLYALTETHPSLRVTACLDASHFLANFGAVLGQERGRRERRKAALDYARNAMGVWQESPMGKSMRNSQQVQFTTSWGLRQLSGSSGPASSDGRGDGHREPEWYHRAQAPWEYFSEDRNP